MTMAHRRAYNGAVLKYAAAAALFAIASVAAGGSVRADDIPTGPAPFVNVRLTSGHVALAVWNRPFVRITTEGSMSWRTVGVTLPAAAHMNMWAERTQTRRGPVGFSQETFVLPPIAGKHRAVLARGAGNVTVLVPQTASLVVVRIFGKGGIGVNGYQGTLIATTRNGTILVRDVTGTAFLQALRGRIAVVNSTFDRVRARTGAGPIIFSRCNAGQIDATSVIGPVLYDNGTLGQGPVHFASEYGSVGVGIANFSAAPAQSVNGTATTSLGAGGAIVTATSMHGTAVIYHGSIATHPELLTRWPRLAPFLRRMAPLRRPPARRIH